MKRIGTAVDLDPKAVKPLVFEQSLDDPEYRENWREGIDIWHNPKAKRPIAEQFLPHVAHHEHLGGGHTSHRVPERHPFGSLTLHTLDE